MGTGTYDEGACHHVRRAAWGRGLIYDAGICPHRKNGGFYERII